MKAVLQIKEQYKDKLINMKQATVQVFPKLNHQFGQVAEEV